MAGRELITHRELAALNRSHQCAVEDIISGCADAPLLAKVLVDQLERAEKDLLRALVILQDKYIHAHGLRLDAKAAPDVAVDELLAGSGIQKAGN